MQTSFKRKPKASSNVQVIPGTQRSLHNGQLLCSTGVPSLDAVIGGGIPVGSVLMVEEDANGQYSNLLSRYFLAEGVMSGHGLLQISHEAENAYINHLPQPVLSNEDTEITASEGDMKIAWRYQNTPKIQTVMGQSSKYGHYYDISKTMDQSKLIDCSLHCISLKEAYFDEADGSNLFKYALQKLHKYVNEMNFDIKAAVAAKQPMKILRVLIPNFGSPIWRCEDPSNFVQFLLCLRNIVRSSLVVCFITVPTHIHTLATVELIRHHVDAVTELEAFGSGKTNPLYKEYHGLLKIHKLPVLNTLLPYMPDTLDLAFKLRRKKFSIERLHLPPDIGEATVQGTESQPYHGGCSSSPGSAMDF